MDPLAEKTPGDISMGCGPQDALAGAIMEGCSVELRETRALALVD